MILRNYDNIMAAKKCHSTSTGTATEFGDGYLTAKVYIGDVHNIYANHHGWVHLPLSHILHSASINQNASTSISSIGSSNIICGSGNTDVSYDDYKLASGFTSKQVTKPSDETGVTETINYDENEKVWIHTVNKRYTANENITISEIGIISDFAYSNSSSAFKSALVYRKVLDTPIEVPAGANFILSLTTTVSANPNKPADYDATAAVAE
jgi:hypothetical protein